MTLQIFLLSFPFVYIFPENPDMADWTQLPKELLDLISKRLDKPFDLLRFRSVCSSWRSSTSSRHNPQRRLQIIGISDTDSNFNLSRRTVAVIALPQTQNQIAPNSWIIKIEEDTPQRMHLLNPLSRKLFNPLPTNFPRILDISRFRVIELGQEFVLQYTGPHGDAGSHYMEKVVFMPKDNEPDVLLTIHISGRLAMFNSGDKQWTIIREMATPYDDVIIFKENFYAVDNMGRTVLVDLCKNVSLVAEFIFGGDKKVLVESGDDLLLVDIYLGIDPEEGLGADDFEIEQYYYDVGERTHTFKVFRLDFQGKQWVEMKNLGDRLLFLGWDCTFSASVGDLYGCRGNCILFEDQRWEGLGISVFDLENGSIEPLRNYSSYSKLFWPPPVWITSPTVEVQNRVEEMAL